MNGKDKHNGFLTIKEFAVFSGVSESMLRCYDRIGLFHPAAHGEGYKSKYRYYLPTQITTLKVILVLTSIGIPLKKIKELAKARSADEVQKVFYSRECEMTNFLRSFSIALSVVKVYSDTLTEATRIIETEIYLSEQPERAVIMGDENSYPDGAGPWQEFIRFCRSERNPELILSFPIGGYFDSMNRFAKAPSQPVCFYSYDPSGNERISAGLYLTGYTRGNYGQTNDLPKRLTAYAQKHNLIFFGPVYNRYLADEISVVDPSQYLLQVSAQVKEKRLTPYHNQRFSF